MAELPYILYIISCIEIEPYDVILNLLILHNDIDYDLSMCTCQFTFFANLKLCKTGCSLMGNWYNLKAFKGRLVIPYCHKRSFCTLTTLLAKSNFYEPNVWSKNHIVWPKKC